MIELAIRGVPTNRNDDVPIKFDGNGLSKDRDGNHEPRPSLEPLDHTRVTLEGTLGDANWVALEIVHLRDQIGPCFLKAPDLRELLIQKLLVPHVQNPNDQVAAQSSSSLLMEASEEYIPRKEREVRDERSSSPPGLLLTLR